MVDLYEIPHTAQYRGNDPEEVVALKKGPPLLVYEKIGETAEEPAFLATLRHEAHRRTAPNRDRSIRNI
jgi:hypothetical protein